MTVITDIIGQRIYHGQQNFAQADPRGNLTFSRLKSVKYEELDVERLNNLIKAIDSSWIVPRKGSREPTGSNFNVSYLKNYSRTKTLLSNENACDRYFISLAYVPLYCEICHSC